MSTMAFQCYQTPGRLPPEELIKETRYVVREDMIEEQFLKHRFGYKNEDGRDVISQLEDGEAPKKLDEFFAARDDTAEMGPIDEDVSLIERAIGVATKVIELQIGLASAFRESKGLERLPEELPLDEYFVAYVVGVSRGSLISIAGGDASEANDWAIMTLSIHHFFGPMGSKQADQGGEAVKFFIATQETQLSMRGQMEGGEDAFAIVEGNIKPKALPKSLAAYLSEG